MKASVTLRAEEQKPPLFRAKLPIAAPLGLPLVSSAAASDSPNDLSFHLRTALPAGPSLKLSYEPRNRFSLFSLSLRSGLGLWGSPRDSPILFTVHLPLQFPPFAAAFPSFLLVLKPQIGDFSFKKTVSPSLPLNPHPVPFNYRNLNGGGIHHPLPVAPPEGRASLEDIFSSSGVQLTATTAIPVTRRSVVKLRCGVNVPGLLPPAAPLWRWRLPYLTIKKICFEAVEDVKIEPKNVGSSEGVMESSKDLGFWIRREAEDLQRENRMIRDNIEEVWKRILDQRNWRSENDGSKSSTRN